MFSLLRSNGSLFLRWSARSSPISRNILPVILTPKRSKWYNPISRFNRNKPIREKSNIILEEPSEENDKQLADIKFVLRSRDIPETIRFKSLKEKLELVLGDEFIFNEKSLPIVNELFMELYKSNKFNINSDIESILAWPQQVQLIQKSSTLLMSQNEREIVVPEFLSLVISNVLKDGSGNISDDLLVTITQLGTKLEGGRLSEVLKLLVKSRGNRLTPNFVNLLLERLALLGTLNLETFESITSWALENPGTLLLDDTYFNEYMRYVEKLFSDTQPKVHEYKDRERSIFRIQHDTAEILSTDLSDLSLHVLLKLVKFTSDLNEANLYQQSFEAMKKLLVFIQTHHSESVCDELARQADAENELLEAVIKAVWFSGLHDLSSKILISLDKNSTLWSSTMQTFGKIYASVETSRSSEKDLAATVNKIIDEAAKLDDINLEKLFDYALLIPLFENEITPGGEYVTDITKHFYQEFDMRPSWIPFKHRIDRALASNDYVTAINIFDDSLESNIVWSEHPDPSILKTFNDLIIATCREIEDVDQVFFIFSRIKQQMVNYNCNVYAINAIAKRMLSVEYVGDAIEMMKRELPNIKKDDTVKLPIDEVYDAAYRELFDTLYKFAIEYDNESTHETNWVLYGEIHKYFYVPFESYLPAMKFFCEHDRHNAALIIFRQMRKLNEMHGNHRHLPPSKEIYLYLFQEFGQKLYEEGVIEVHESIKMDVALPNPDIMIKNSILNAYSNLQDVGKARDLFLSMAPTKNLAGGINEETIQIMIKTYTYSDMEYVKSFWNNLSSFDIIPNASIFRQYLIAHVYHGLPEEAIQLTEEMDDYELEVDTQTIASLYNFCMTTHDQDVIEKWASTQHPQLWVDVKTNNLLKRSDNYEPETSMLIEGSH